MDAAVEKIKKLKEICKERNLSPIIEVDGGVNEKNAKMLIDAGANCIVAGGSVFKADDKIKAINALRCVSN